VSAPALVFDGVVKRYGAVRALDGLDLSVPTGAVVGLIGPNGAGKTTTIGLALGLLRPDAGRVRMGGAGVRPGRPMRGRAAALPQDSALPAERRVRDELVWLARLQGHGTAEARRRAEAALSDVGLEALAERRIGHLSHGQRRRVGVAQALLGEEPLLLLDEPTSGVDPRSALEIRRDIGALTKDRTLVWSSHDLTEVEELCTHVFILDRGRVVASGPMEELRQATRMLRIDLAPPGPDRAPLLASLEALPGVASVDLDSSNVRLVIRCDPEASLDEVTHRVLARLLDRRLFVRGVTRGERLAERFWAATAATR